MQRHPLKQQQVITMTISIHIYLRIILAAVTVCIPLTSHAEKPYIWSVVPQFTGVAVHRDWSPLLRAIENDTGYKFELKIYESIRKFEVGFAIGEPDFAYMNPYHTVMAKKEQGYEPILRDGKRQLTGILVTRKDSPIKKVEDLVGMKISFPSPNAFAASLYPRALLSNQFGIQYTPVFAKTHSNSYRYTLLNKTSASGGVYRTLERERPELQNQLRVLFKSPSTASHPLTAHKRVPQEVVNAVQQSIIALTGTKEGKSMLKAILMPQPVVADYDRDYKMLQDLHLENYVINANND